MDVTENIVPAFLLTVLAGLSTGIGSAIAYFIRKPKITYLSFSLGVSAGVMIYISFMELLPAASRWRKYRAAGNTRREGRRRYADRRSDTRNNRRPIENLARHRR